MARRIHLYEFLACNDHRLFLGYNRQQVKAYLQREGMSGYKAEQYLFYRGKVKEKDYPEALNLPVLAKNKESNHGEK